MMLYDLYLNLAVTSVGSPQVTQLSSSIAIDARHDALHTFVKMPNIAEWRKSSGNAMYVQTKSFSRLRHSIAERTDDRIARLRGKADDANTRSAQIGLVFVRFHF